MSATIWSNVLETTTDLNRYMPDGNSKFGALSISTPPTSDQSELKYRLFIDGQEAWSHKILTPPVVHGSGRGKDALWG